MLWTGLAALAGILAVGAALWSAPRWLLPAIAGRYPGCFYASATEEPALALTIDDGPDAVTTPRILEILARHGASATFFLISSHIQGNDAVVSAIVDGGHEIGNHLTHDVPSIALSPEVFEAALLEADAALSRYAEVRWARPGSGLYNSRMVATMQRHNYHCALGSVYPYDTHVPWAWLSYRYILRNVRPGAIVVLHDRGKRGRRTAATLGKLLPELTRRGYRVVTLSELVAALPSN